MTIIYIPRLIESAEQAEALPLFTIATIEDSPVTGYPEVARKIVNGWRNRDLVDGRIPHTDMIGWTALVPIEAEEEVVWHDKWDDAYQRTAEKDAARLAAHPIGADVRRIFITPWESA